MQEKIAQGQARDAFTFQRMGGIDQAILQTDYDWQHLDELDPKLWMALSCPIHGLEFNADTLKLLDTDNDGRIRAHEVKDAAAWICARLIHPSIISRPSDEVRLSDLRDDTDEGKAIASALRLALQKYDKKEEEPLSLPNIEAVLAEASGYAFNGDGIVTLESAVQAAAKNSEFADMAEFMATGIGIIGAMRDASGVPGLDPKLLDQIRQRASAIQEWRLNVKNADLPLAAKTGEAWTLLQRLAPKFDDYFCRCKLAAYAPDTIGALNEDARLQALAAGTEEAPVANLDPAVLAQLPLARVAANGELDLENNLNPVWAEDVHTFAKLFASELQKNNILTADIWKNIWHKFTAYATILQSKPTFPLPPADAVQVDFEGLPPLKEAPANDEFGRAFLPLEPNQALDSLSDEQIEKLLKPEIHTAFAKLVKMDEEAPPLTSFQDLYKLALFHAHLYTFTMNFLSFMDFYDPDKKAIFQTGTLYLDSRGCMLSVPVEDIDAHARLADPSHLCLIYSECTRKETDGAEQNMTIASALTQGTLASLLDGRHGLFIDNHGRQWDSRIARIVHNPVSLREAVWSPYIRLANMASEQIQKFVSSKEEAVTDMAGKAAANVASGAKPAEAKGGFDFAKGAGIFAAVSVALSVVSAAFAYIASSVASLGWWWPLALVLAFVCISGPSVFLAWLKLRRRTLGPLLDASGWAVNKGAPINLAMGASLTSVGKLPKNAVCDPNDPYSLPGKMLRKKWKHRFWWTVFLLILACIGCFWLYIKLMGEPLWLFTLRAYLGI